MKVLVLGSGAREHAICWKLTKSSLLTELFVASGNPGTEKIAENLDIDISVFDEIVAVLKKEHIGMLIIGPEQPLVDGLVDYLKTDNELSSLRIIGPNKLSAQLEGSKAFAKRFMLAQNIPTAAYLEVTKSNIQDGMTYLSEMTSPYVLKADGLAAGKGVIITSDIREAHDTLTTMLDGQFGEASKKVVIESFLDGIEFSVFALVSGENYVLLPAAKDYKKIGDGDTGPNTGGMGAVSPVPFYDEVLQHKVKEQIIDPTIKGLVQMGIHYQGFIFFGLINCQGSPYVIEYNCRLGDPETQAILPRLQNDLLDLFIKCSDNELPHVPMRYSQDYVSNVVLASRGYPGNYSRGYAIDLNDLPSDKLLFHAGTKSEGNQLLTNGGRVISCCAKADTIDSALKSSYELVEQIQFSGKTYRTDIGKDLK